jgi:hypothetical protein
MPADQTTEYAIRVDVPHPRRTEKPGDLITNIAPETARRCREIWHGWTPVQRTTSPWTPTTEEASTDA